MSITILKASSLAIKLFNPSSLERIKPSLKAHSSAIKLLVLLSALAYPLIVLPLPSEGSLRPNHLCLTSPIPLVVFSKIPGQ